MPFILVATMSRANTTTGGFTTGTVSTVGSNLIVVAVCSYGGTTEPTLTDSRGNSYTKLTPYNSTFARTTFYYVINGTVSGTHSFTVTGANSYPTLHMACFSGATGSSYVSATGSTQYISGGSVTSAQPGTLSPPENNCLLLTSINSYQNDALNTIDSSYTITGAFKGNIQQSGVNLNTALAYKIQTASNAENPKWTLNNAGTGTNNFATNHLLFKTGAATTPPNSGFFFLFL